MKSFAAALLISSAVAQTNSTSTAAATVKDAAQTAGNFFSGLVKDYLGTTAVVQEFTAVAATAAEPTTLTGSAQWDTTPLGFNYVTMNLKLATPASNLVAKTNALVYFQIEKPVFPAATRLLHEYHSPRYWYRRLRRPRSCFRITRCHLQRDHQRNYRTRRQLQHVQQN